MDPEVERLVFRDEKYNLTDESVQKLKIKQDELTSIIEMWIFQQETYKTFPTKEKFNHILNQFSQIKWLLNGKSEVVSDNCKNYSSVLKKMSEKINGRLGVVKSDMKDINNSVVAIGSVHCGDINISTFSSSKSSAKKSKNPKADSSNITLVQNNVNIFDNEIFFE